jgi:hypothetical protein
MLNNTTCSIGHLQVWAVFSKVLRLVSSTIGSSAPAAALTQQQQQSPTRQAASPTDSMRVQYSQSPLRSRSPQPAGAAAGSVSQKVQPAAATVSSSSNSVNKQQQQQQQQPRRTTLQQELQQQEAQQHRQALGCVAIAAVIVAVLVNVKLL